MLTGVCHRDHITQVFSHLHWLPVCFQVQLKVLVLIFKAQNGLGQQTWRTGLLLYQSTQSLWSSSEALLHVPPLPPPPPSKDRWVAIQERTFWDMTLELWNPLLQEISLSPIIVFCQQMKTVWHCLTNSYLHSSLLVCVQVFILCFILIILHVFSF